MIIDKDLSLFSVLPGRHTVPTSNLSREEEVALDRLRCNLCIIIKPADKGAVAVVLSTIH